MTALTFIPQDQMDMAVLFRLFVFAQKSADFLEPDAIASLFQIEVGPKRVSLALENLAEKGWVHRRTIPGLPASINTAGYAQVEKFLVDKDSFVFSYAQLGDEWLEKQTLSALGIPASDRIVSRSDNIKAVDALSESISEIAAEVATNNEVGSVLGDEREIVQNEIAAAQIILSGSRFKLRNIYELLLPMLKYLADKFSSAAIGETAKHIIKLLADLI